MLEEIYNNGARLIPGKTHDILEVIRHKSSYKVFKKIIEADILNIPLMLNQKIKILDIGCGTAHGTFMISDILRVEIIAIDISKESIIYAEQDHGVSNIKYTKSDLLVLLKKQKNMIMLYHDMHLSILKMG